MTNLFQQFKGDEKSEKEGIVLLYGKNSKDENIEFRIARAGGTNTRYLKALEHKSKPYRRQIQNNSMDLEMSQQLMRDVFAEAVLLGWTGVEDADNNPIEFTVTNAKQLFKDLPDLFADIQEQANNASLFRASLLDDEAKN